MSKASNRPPKLESRVGESRPAPPPTLEARVDRAKIAGPAASGPGPTELRRNIDRLALGDRGALRELAPIAGLTAVDAWEEVARAFGASPEVAAIDAARTVAAVRAAAARVRVVASTPGARVAVATANPASLLTVHLAFAGLARGRGADVVDLVDFGPIRADGRTPRWLRWVGGVAVVSDARSLCDTRDGEAAREWMFAIPRPSLVVADGPFAEVAWESGGEVVALTGLDRPGLAIAAARGGRGTIVPMHTDRPARSYAVIEEIIAAVGGEPEADVTPSPSSSDTEL